MLILFILSKVAELLPINFALRVFRMVEKLPKSKEVEVIIYQLLENLLKEANELVAIFTAAIKTSKNNS